MGAYSRWAIINFLQFSATLFCVNMMKNAYDFHTSLGIATLIVRPRCPLRKWNDQHNSCSFHYECQISFSFLSIRLFGGRVRALIQGLALINSLHVLGGRLLKVGAKLRLGANSNKYGIKHFKYRFPNCETQTPDGFWWNVDFFTVCYLYKEVLSKTETKTRLTSIIKFKRNGQN